MLVGRNGLGGQLSADPVGVFRQDHPQAGAAGRERRGAAAEAPADDDEIGGPLNRAIRPLDAGSSR